MLLGGADILRKEFKTVLAERKFQALASALTEQVEARVIQWRQVGYTPTIYRELSRMPAVMLDGVAIAAVDFLDKPIPTDQPFVIVISSENRENRSYRISRLKTASTIGESPGLEFLAECWEDIFLRSQVKALVTKYPSWGIGIALNPELGLIQVQIDVCATAEYVVEANPSDFYNPLGSIADANDDIEF